MSLSADCLHLFLYLFEAQGKVPMGGSGQALLELGEAGPGGCIYDGQVLVLPRMGSDITTAQIHAVLLGVANGGLHRGMDEQLLDVTEVRSVSEEMGSAGLPQAVDGEPASIEA